MTRRFLCFSASLFALGISAVSLRAEIAVQQVYDDAKVIRRVAEVAGRATPREVLEKIAREDLEILRGKRPDDTYQYAHYERDEASRQEEDFTVAAEGKASKQKIRADFAYRLVISAPSRRYLVRKNRPVFVERIELETTPFTGSAKYETIDVGVWLDPGGSKTIELPEITRRAAATLHAHVDPKSGPASLDLTMIEARVVDNPDSPYAGSARNVKLLMDNLRRGDVSNLVTLSNLVVSDLGKRADVPAGLVAPAPPAPSVVATPATEPSRTSIESMPNVEIYMELQSIEDLLTGNDSERREGVDRLHQLIRRLRQGN